MFIPCLERKGSVYFEFQYCKKELSIKKLLRRGYSFKEKDSLLIHVDDDRRFFENYGKSLEKPNSPDGTQKLYPYGVNYYTKEQTLTIIEQIENDKPPYYETLATWLKKAITDYNGFFFLGI